MSLNGLLPNNSNHTQIQPASRSRMINNTHPQSTNHRRDNGVKAEASSGQSNPIKASRTHNELHKELLLAHKRREDRLRKHLDTIDSSRGLALSSRSELQQVLERRKRVQSDREEEGQSRTPLEDVLLRRQQKQQEKEKEQEEKVREEAQLMEFVRVRQNLRKIHSAIQNKAANSAEDGTQNV
ncbi:protein FAM107B isoform 1-T1 [Symphorus nematophorus]